MAISILRPNRQHFCQFFRAKMLKHRNIDPHAKTFKLFHYLFLCRTLKL
jgi:hypothetical protein